MSAYQPAHPRGSGAPRRRRAAAAVGLPAVGAVWLLLLALGLVSCAGKDGGGPVSPPVQNGELTLQGYVVSWTSDLPTRGWVRYGFAAGQLDHAAYPASAGRGDRALRTRHDVPLLDLTPGRRVYAQAVSEATAGTFVTTAVDTFTPAVASPTAVLTSTMIHIGFGDAHLVIFPTSGKRLMIDAGPRSGGRAVSDFLTRKGVTHIDAMLATHVHLDHLGGMIGSGSDSASLLVAFPPQVFFDSPSKTIDKSAYDDALDLLAANPSIQRVVLHRFDTDATVPQLAFDPLVAIRVLNSGRPDDVPGTGYEGTIINNESIVLRFSYGDVDFIIGGDAEDQTTASMLADFTPAELEVEFYKAQHHGLQDANSAAWINALRPRVAFIPNTDQVWDGDLVDAIAACTGRLQAIYAHIYVIDDVPTLDQPRGSGAQHNITFATDGVSYEVRVELAPQATLVGTELHKCE